MSEQKSGSRVNRREFLRLTNKAGVALILAGGVLDVIHPEKVFSALRDGRYEQVKDQRPVQRKTIVTKQAKNDNIIVSSTLTLKDKDYLLNSEGSFLWNLCNGRHSLNMMADALALKYKKAPEIVASDIYNFVKTLKSLNMIEFTN